MYNNPHDPFNNSKKFFQLTRFVCAIFLPPLSVFLILVANLLYSELSESELSDSKKKRNNFYKSLLDMFNVLLTSLFTGLGFIPGIIYALYLNKEFDKDIEHRILF